ncbi:hypothetical protein ACOSJ1_CBNAJBGD_01503 [Enterococcus faecium]|nr:hypothetical protein ACOSJ1_CBNAJBGD_01503 [Enterococcus faecium]CAH2258894.1 hypothetical protein ACOSJ1_MOIKCCMD_01431 [Enterococcus faecium]
MNKQEKSVLKEVEQEISRMKERFQTGCEC